MKVRANALLKVIIVCAMFLFAATTFSYASAENIAILEKSETEYILYFSTLLKAESFEYAFSNNELDTEDNLNYILSTQDTDGNTVAYIDADLYKLYFENKEATYLWVKVPGESEEESIYVEKATKLELVKNDLGVTKIANTVTDEIVDFVKNTTKRIEAATDSKETEVTEKDGIKYTVTVGAIEILNNSENEPYSYSLIKMPSTDEYNKFFELAEKIYNQKETDAFINLVNTKNFYDMYQELLKNVTWTKVENNKILQPRDSQNGEQYIAWLKNEENQMVDVKFLTSYRETDQEFIKEEIIVKETHKLPITYDNIILFVLLGIAVVLFIIVLVMKKKSNKNQNEG